MGFNYAKEKQRFEKYWAAIRQQYETAGMDQDAIEELHDFDWDWFRSRRRYINHLSDLPDGLTIDDLPQDRTARDSLWEDGRSRYHWLDEIEDEQLLQRLVLLSQDDIELITQLVFEEHTQSEIAQRLKRNQQSVSRQFSQIKKILRKSV